MEEKRNIYFKLHSVKSAGIKLKRDSEADAGKFKYYYADLSQIQEKLGKALQEQGLIVIHSVIEGKVRTEIRDIDSDNFVFSEIEMTTGIKPQDKGSEISYYRRYNLLSLLDLEVEDDDGKKAQNSKQDKPKEEKNWLNFETFKQIVEAGNDTEAKIAQIIKEDGYSLSNQAKIAVRHYCDTGELDKSLFFKK